MMERRFFILIFILAAFFTLVFYFRTSLASEQYDEDSLNFYVRAIPFHKKLSTQEKMDKIKSLGAFTVTEKKELIEFLDKQPGYVVASWSTIIKGDLNTDGQMEYIIQDLLIAEPKPSSFGTQLAVVQKVNKGLDLIIVSPPTRGRTFGREVRIEILDVDQDGPIDLVVKEHDPHGDPEDPRGDLDYAAIYRNNHMRFQQIYEQDHMYDELRFKDLDNDGQLEILETVNELPYETYQENPKWRWINIYQWNGTRLEQVNNKFLSFYLQQEKLYRSLLQEASAKASEYRKKGKKTIWDTTERAIKAYIERIAEMKRLGEQKSK